MTATEKERFHLGKLVLGKVGTAGLGIFAYVALLVMSGVALGFVIVSFLSPLIPFFMASTLLAFPILGGLKQVKRFQNMKSLCVKKMAGKALKKLNLGKLSLGVHFVIGLGLFLAFESVAVYVATGIGWVLGFMLLTLIVWEGARYAIKNKKELPSYMQLVKTGWNN